MIKISPYSTNNYTKQNFKSDKKTNPQNKNITDKKTKKNSFVDATIVTIPTGLGAGAGYKQTTKKKSKLLTEAKSYMGCWDREKPEVTKLKDFIQATLLPDFIYREREGKLSDIPNCIMITGGDEKYQKEVIQWIADKSPCRFVTVEYGKNILEKLEQQGATFKKPGTDHTLIHYIGMDKLINPKTASFSCIESMKDIMSSTVEDYNTTLIFSTQHPEELDSIALQPHRVRSATLNVPRDDFFYVEDCVKRVNAIAEESKKISMKKNILVGTLIGLLIGVGSVLIKNILFKNKK